jgi:trans-aconitate methyltransferase
LECKSSKNAKEIQGYLGMADYRRFIEGFSKIAGPMIKLLSKNATFVWPDECKVTFQKLIEKLTTTPVLAVPEAVNNYMVYSDVSN